MIARMLGYICVCICVYVCVHVRVFNYLLIKRALPSN